MDVWMYRGIAIIGGFCPLMMPIFKSASTLIFEKDPETSSG